MVNTELDAVSNHVHSIPLINIRNLVNLFQTTPYIFNAEAINAITTATETIDTDQYFITASHLLSSVLKQRDTSLYKALYELVPNLEDEIVDIDNKNIPVQKTQDHPDLQMTFAFKEAIHLAAKYSQHKNQPEITLPDLFYGLISSEFLTPAVMFANIFHITPRKLEKYL